MWAVVTGASSGIGEEIAKKLAEKGYNLVLVARSKEKMEKLADSLKVESLIVDVDLTADGATEEVYEKSKDKDVRILVNNAGFGGHGDFESRQIEEDGKMIDLNIKAVTDLCHLFIPILKKKEKSYLLNVASSAGFLPGPGMAVYYATKAYVLSLSEALHEELANEGMVVTALCPGPVDTGFADAADMNGVNAFEAGVTSPEFVAQKALEGMFDGKSIVIPGVGLSLMLRIGLRFLPRSVVRKMSKKMMEKA